MTAGVVSRKSASRGRSSGGHRRGRVVIVQEALPAYRVALFVEIRERAGARGIDVQLVHGHAPGARGERLGGGRVPGAIVVQNRYLPRPGTGTPAVWQPVLRHCLQADVVVVEQANRLLVNYVLLLAARFGGPKVAFWGHGRNFQSQSTSASERLKSRLVALPNWWFAYTDRVAALLVERGVPRSHITVVRNTIDVVALRSAVDACRVTQNEAGTMRCVFLGGLYAHKRLSLLFEAADEIARQLPDFELHIAGAGEQRPAVEDFVRGRDWARYIGPVAGQARAELLASARLLLIPGLVGLVVVDSFAAGVPLITTADALHSPEVEYLEDGVNGVVMPGGCGPREYADAAIRLLQDEARWAEISAGARRSAATHTIADAADRFVIGLESALRPRLS